MALPLIDTTNDIQLTKKIIYCQISVILVNHSWNSDLETREAKVFCQQRPTPKVIAFEKNSSKEQVREMRQKLNNAAIALC